MKKTIAIVLCVFSFLVSSWGQQSDTLFLRNGIHSVVRVEKVKTGYFIGDEPVLKTQRTYTSNSDEFCNWFKNKKCKHLTVYCGDFEPETEKHASKNGDAMYVDYITDIKGLLEIYRYELARDGEYMLDVKSVEIDYKPLTDSLKMKYKLYGEHPMFIVGTKGDIIEKSVTVKSGIFDRVIINDAPFLNDGKKWSSKFNVLENVPDKKDTVIVFFNTVRKGVNMKKYQEAFKYSLENTLNLLSEIGFEHVITSKDESLYDGQIVVNYKDYE